MNGKFVDISRMETSLGGEFLEAEQRTQTNYGNSSITFTDDNRSTISETAYKTAPTAFKKICQYSYIPSFFLYYIGLIILVISIAADSWRYNRIEYSIGDVKGLSSTMLGGFSMRRVDRAVKEGVTRVFETRYGYRDILENKYCNVHTPTPKDPKYQYHPEIWRQIDDVGLLDVDKHPMFFYNHGRPIYDVMCSGIRVLEWVNGNTFISVAVAGVLFVLQFGIAISRNIYNKTAENSSVYWWYESIFSFLWATSGIIGIYVLFYYALAENFDFCVDKFGEIFNCPLGGSYYLFMVFTICNILSYAFYILYGISLRNGVQHEPVSMDHYYRYRNNLSSRNEKRGIEATDVSSQLHGRTAQSEV